MDKTKLIEEIIANDCCLEEGDSEWLSKMSDDKLKKMRESQKGAAALEVVANAARKEFTDSLGTVHTWNEEKGGWESKKKEKEPKPVKNEDQQNAPALTPEQEADIAFARKIRQERRAKAIETIKANEANKFTDELLQGMSDEALQAAADSIPKKQAPAPNYAGNSGASGVRNSEEGFAPFGLPGDYIKAEV